MADEIVNSQVPDSTPMAEAPIVEQEAPNPNEIDIYDISGEAPVLGKVPSHQVQEAIASGRFSLPQGEIQVFDSEGQLGNIPAEEAKDAFNEGYRYATPEEINKYQKEQTYGSPGQQVLAGVEAFGRGVLGPLAPLAERALGVDPEAMRAREEVNPITAGVGELAGFTGSMLTGVGQAKLLEKAGAGASKALGLSKPLTYGSKVGDAITRNAVENAVYQLGSEASKVIMTDPEASVDSAIANVGLAAAIGGGAGAALTGVASPLWDATVGKKFDQYLGTVKDWVNGEGKIKLTPEVAGAAETLGMEMTPLMKAAVSGDERAGRMFNELREVQHPEVMQAMTDLKTGANKSVLESLKMSPEEIVNYSENKAGQDIIDTLKREYKTKYGGIQEAYDSLKKDSASLNIPDESRLRLYTELIEDGQNFGAVGSPYQKLFDTYSERMLAQDTLGQMDNLVTELNGELSKAYRAGDNNTYSALKQIKTKLQDFQDSQIIKTTKGLEKEGLEYGAALGRDFVKERAAARAEYAKIAKLSNELADHIGISDFKGGKNFLASLAESKSPEQMLRALSPKNNASIIPFLQANFPQTLAKVQNNEIKSLIKPSILAAKGDEAINLKVLTNAIEKGLAGRPELIKFTVPDELLSKVKAANLIESSFPSFKSSGTAGWQQKLMKYFPQSAGAAVSVIAGGNPIIGAVVGHGASMLGRDAPDAMKLGLLKFLASEKELSAPKLKASIDFIQQALKGQSMMNKGAKALFQSGTNQFLNSLEPDKKTLDKLDKRVTKFAQNPMEALNTENQLEHYMPEAGTAAVASISRAAQYLNQLKPQITPSSPLDPKREPTAQEMAVYNRQLAIAQQPLSVLSHIKNGTLQPQDIITIKTITPKLYNELSTKLMDNLADAVSDGASIPYTMRQSLSLFLGQPLDTTFTPQGIQSSQLTFMPPPQQPQAPGVQKVKKNTSSLGKSNETYRTPTQDSEFDRSKRS